MGSQLYSADAVARLAAQALPRPSTRIEKPSGGFDSMLKEARSAREASRRKVERSEPTEEEDSAPEVQPASDQNPAPVAQDDTAARAESSADTTAQSKTGADAAPVAANQNEAPSEQPAPSESQGEATPEGDKPTVQPVLQVAQPNAAEVGEATGETKVVKPFAGTPQLETEGLDWNPQPVTPAPAAAVPSGQEAVVVSQAVADGANAEAIAKQNNSTIATSDQAVSEASDQQETAFSSPQQTPVARRPENQKVPPKPASADQPVKDDARPQIGRESVHNLKMDASLAERKAGRIEAHTGQAKDSEAATSRTGSGKPAADPGVGKTQITDAAESALPTGFRVTSGDNTAAAIARFLVTTPGDSGGSAAAAATTAVAAPSASSPAAPSGEARANQAITGPSTIVASGVLSSGSDASAGIDATARVLNASSGDGRFHVTMQLDPPELGQLRVQVRMDQHVMTMQIDADTASSARLIESRLSDLRDNLAAHGIRMDRSDVVIRSPASAESNPQNQDGGQNGSGQQGRGETGGSGGWLSDGRQARGSGEQGLGNYGAGNYGQVNDSDGSAAVVDDNRAAVEVMSTTELSLDLVA